MAFSPAVLAELHVELENLQRQRLRLEERIAAIRQLIIEDSPPRRERVAERAQTEQRQGAGLFEPTPPADDRMTVKGIVLGALKETPGVKAAAITKMLRKRGFKPGGTTRLSHRVYNELWRMTRDGEITKTPDGRFFPKEGTAA